jgi:predicted  nucleic acid-binding Zn-ribbon protein
MKTNRETIARVEFRWRQHEEEFAQRLTESARAAGRCASDHARELMKNALTSTEQLQHAMHTLQQEVAQMHHQLRQLADIAEALRALQENVFALRDDLATYATKLLTDAGRVEAKAARKWVEEVLRTD